MIGPAAIVIRFNDRINARDIDGLVALMTDDHRFVDSAGHTVTGRPACREAWRSFFEAFPTYRNEFETVQVRGDTVIVIGRSVCTEHGDLDGRAIWTATVVAPAVAEWRVHDDTPDDRELLGLPPT